MVWKITGAAGETALQTNFKQVDYDSIQQGYIEYEPEHVSTARVQFAINNQNPKEVIKPPFKFAAKMLEISHPSLLAKMKMYDISM